MTHGDWKCAICQESDQKEQIVAHAICIQGKVEGDAKAYSND